MRTYKLNPDKSIERIEDGLGTISFAQSNRVVQYDEFPNESLSTVFLVFDHNHNQEGEPLLFETMLFSTISGDEILKRHSTYQEALSFHQETVKNILTRMMKDIDVGTDLPKQSKNRL